MTLPIVAMGAIFVLGIPLTLLVGAISVGVVAKKVINTISPPR